MLRAPSIYHTVIAKGGRRLVSIRDIATVRLGVTTGANGFFYLDQNKIRAFGIESKFLRPILRTPRESRSIAVSADQLLFRAFVCSEGMEGSFAR